MTTRVFPCFDLSGVKEHGHHALLQSSALRIEHMNEDLAREAYALGYQLFALSQEEKMQCLRRGFGSGYTPPGVESQGMGVIDRARESWDFRSPGKTANIYPVALPQLREVVESVYAIMSLWGKTVFRLLYPDLGDLVYGSNAMLRFAYYPPALSGEEVFRGHVDPSVFSEYLGGAPPGLEWQDAEGVWHPVINPLGSLVISVGTALTLYDKRIKAFRHRVVGSKGPRVSIVLFLDPSEDVILPDGRTGRERQQKLVSAIRSDIECS